MEIGQANTCTQIPAFPDFYHYQHHAWVPSQNNITLPYQQDNTTTQMNDTLTIPTTLLSPQSPPSSSQSIDVERISSRSSRTSSRLTQPTSPVNNAKKSITRHNSTKSTVATTTTNAIADHYKRPVLLSLEEQLVLLKHFNKTSTQEKDPPKSHPWNEHPSYTESQVLAFTPAQWQNRIFKPLKILMDKKRTGTALRFLAYVPLAPPKIRIPSHIFDHASTLGIAGSTREIAYFFKRELSHIQTASSALRHSNRFSETDMRAIGNLRRKGTDGLMKGYKDPY
jgi:hypothetical protein